MKDLVCNAKRALAILLAVVTVMTGNGIAVYAEELSTNENDVYMETSEDAAVGTSDEDKEEEEAVLSGETGTQEEPGTSEEPQEAGVSDEEEPAVSPLEGSEEEESQEPSSEDGAENDLALNPGEEEIIVGEEEVGGGLSADSNNSAKPASSLLADVKYDKKVMKATISKKGWIKVSYKLKGAKYYTLQRLSADGESLVTMPGREKSKKKSYTDKQASQKSYTDATYIYLMTAYDKMYNEMGSYAVIPAPLMLSVQTVEDTKYAEVRFLKLKGSVSYKIERSDVKKKEIYYNEVRDLKASELNGVETKVSFYNGDDGKTGEQFEYICYKDRDGDFSYNTKHYYRVQAYIEDTEIKSLYSKALTLKASLPQPEMISIEGPHEDKGTCYKEGYFTFGIPENMDIDKVKYFEIYRSTKKDTGYKRIKKVKVDYSPGTATVTSLDGNQVRPYEPIKYTKFPPRATYYYKVRAIGRVKSVKGAFSEWVEHTSQFAPVTDVVAETVNQKTLKVSWKSEKCATKYNIYRYGPFTTSPMNAQEIFDNASSKKIATVANKPSDKGIVSYKDSKNLKNMQYYLYRIEPVNGKQKGPLSTDPACACTRIMGPTKVTAEGISFTQIDVTWNASYNPTSYIVQRATSSPNGEWKWEELATLKSGQTGFKNRKYSDKKSASNPLEVGLVYRYRVLATVKVNGQDVRSDEDTAMVAEGYLRPGAPKSVAISLLLSNSSWAGNKVSWKRPSDADHITQYVLERRTSTKEDWKEVKRFDDTGKSDTTYSHQFTSDKSRGTHYYYRVYAVYSNNGVTINGHPAEVNLVMPSKISLASESATLKVGETYKVKVGSFTPDDTTYKDMVFTNSDTSVIQSTSSGTENGYAYVIFKAKKKGTATVTVKPKYYTGTSSDLVKKCTIKVE